VDPKAGLLDERWNRVDRPELECASPSGELELASGAKPELFAHLLWQHDATRTVDGDDHTHGT